jgi:hypothetical protein
MQPRKEKKNNELKAVYYEMPPILLIITYDM